MQEREGGGPENESPLQRWQRQAQERIRQLLQEIGESRASDQQKEQRKKREADRHIRELKEVVDQAERDRGSVDEADFNRRIFEVQELARQKLYPHLSDVSEKALIALARTRMSTPQAIVVGKIMNEIVTSPQFRAAAGRGAERARESLRNLARRLRRERQSDLADEIEAQVRRDEEQEQRGQNGQNGEGRNGEDGQGPEPGGEGGGEGGDGGNGEDGPGGPENPEPPDGGDDNGEGGNGYSDDETGRLERELDRLWREKKNEKWLDMFKDDDNERGVARSMRPGYQKSLIGMAIRTQVPLTKEQQVLLRALDGGDEFKTYFRAKQKVLEDENVRLRAEGKDTIDNSYSGIYSIFKNDVKDVINELLSSLSGTVDSSRKEIAFVAQVTDKVVRTVSRDISGDKDFDRPGMIKLKYPTFLPSQEKVIDASDPDNEAIGGVREYVEQRAEKKSLSEALEQDLATTISKLTKITYGVNNARDKAYNGDSHEDLSGQVKNDGVKISDLVWLFQKEDDVRVGYNFFIHALEQLKAQTGRTITERYGSMSKNQLTEAEERAWMQMLAHDDKYREHKRVMDELKDNLDNLSPEDRKKFEAASKAVNKLKQNKRRAIKLASGIAWGFTKESWGVLLDAKLLTGWSKDSETGELRTSQHYGGSQQKGLEKMLAELHPEVNDNRWGRDKIAPIWMTYQPRDLEMAKGPWQRKELYSHSRLYDLFQQHDAAFYRGRSDDLADFDDEFVTMHEFANVTAVHALRRESWRLRQYEKHVNEYKREAKNEFDLDGKDMHEHVIRRLMVRGGPRLVKMYIDGNVKDLIAEDPSQRRNLRLIKKGERSETVAEKSGLELNMGVINEKKARLKGKQAKMKAKESLYAKYIFDDLQKRFVSSFAAFEQPRYMPSSERTIYADLNEYVAKELPNVSANILQTDVYPLFLDSVHMVERHKWESYYRSPDVSDEKELKRRQASEPEEVDFSNLDDEVVEKLKIHFELFQTKVGEVDGYDMSQFSGMSFEDYLTKLKGFQEKLKKKVEDPSRRSRNKGGERQTLSQRYAHMLTLDQGGINQMLGGSYFDYTLDMQQGGVDAVNRLGSDTQKAVDMTKAWDELAGDGGVAENFMRAGYEDDDEEGLKKGASEIADKINEICKYPYSFSPDQGNEYKIRHEIFWARAFSKPDAFRTGIFGKVGEHFWRSRTGGQPNLFAEYYQKILGRTDITSLDADQLRVVLEQWEKDLRVPRKRFEVAEYEKAADIKGFRGALRKVDYGVGKIPLVGGLSRRIMRSVIAPLSEARPTKFRNHDFHQNLVFKELSARKRDTLIEGGLSWKSVMYAGVIAYLLYEAAQEKNKDVDG